MPESKPSHNPDIVQTVFSRPSKKKASRLFDQKGRQNIKEPKPPSPQILISKRYPFGLDIGTHSLKIVQLGLESEGRIRVIHALTEDFPASVREHPEQKAIYISEILRKISKSLNLKDACFTHVPISACKLDLIKLPKIPPQEVDKAMYWEIQQQFRRNPDEITYDYLVLEKQSRDLFDNDVGFLVIVTQRKVVHEQLGLLKSVGLETLAIDVEALSDVAALSYGNGYLHEQEVVLYLDFGAGQTTVGIISNKELISVRSLNITGNFLTKAISQYCQTSWEEAELLKREHGISIGTGDQTLDDQVPEMTNHATQVRNAILSHLENLVQDIEHTFKHFSFQITRSQITKYNRVIVCGGASSLKGFVPFLTSRLSVPVTLADPLGDLMAGQMGIPTGGAFNVALGLALRGLEE